MRNTVKAAYSKGRHPEKQCAVLRATTHEERTRRAGITKSRSYEITKANPRYFPARLMSKKNESIAVTFAAATHVTGNPQGANKLGLSLSKGAAHSDKRTPTNN